METDTRIEDVADMLGELTGVRDLATATTGVSIYDVGGEIEAEDYFLPILNGNYGDARAIIRILTANDRFPSTPDDVANGF